MTLRHSNCDKEATTARTTATDRTSALHGVRNPMSAQSKAVWVGRIIFLVCLFIVATVLGVATFHVLQQAEIELAETQFESLAERALMEAQGIAYKKRLGTISMASVAAQMLPDASAWPFVTLPGYETIANNIIATSAGREMGFCPLVRPEQLSDFENFAYDYFENKRIPPFPNGTGMSSFGKGVWGKDENSTAPDKRYRVTNGDTNYGSPYKVIVPILQHNLGPFPALMLNLRFEKDRGLAVDEVLDCSKQRAASDNPDEFLCGVLTDMVMLTSQKNGTGPGALIFQPVYPVHDKTQLVGLISSSIVWDETLRDVFATEVSGVHCVLRTDNQIHTYEVVGGVARSKGEGDLHQKKYDRFEQTISLTGENLYSPKSTKYTLALYPSDQFFEVYSTGNPWLATIGSVAIIMFTSLFFFLYDFFVRQEFSAKKEMLEARRRFVRFVSHEVRTPLNSVVMALELMQEEMASCLGYRGADDLQLALEKNISIAGKDDAVSRVGTEAENVTEWFGLARDILDNAQSAVDVLNDLLNYDKVEMGMLSLELTVIPIWQLIEYVWNEFKLPAARKMIDLKLEFNNGSEEDAAGTQMMAQSTKNLSLSTLNRKCVGDEVRIKQVLRNLISNALKFTPEHGTIRVVVSSSGLCEKSGHEKATKIVLKDGSVSTFQTSGQISVSVHDTGVGLSEEQLAELFRDGIQFNVNDLQAGQGSGLGLYISKGIVEKHAGSLVATSEGLGHGTTFTMTIPLYYISDSAEDPREASQASADSRSKRLKDPTPLRILVVDDVSSNRKLLARLLKHHGHHCDEADNGQVAIDMVERSGQNGEKYDTILLDYEMPVMDGPTAAKEIRAKGFDIFIVGITGNVLPDDVTYFRSCGANAILPKPFKLATLEDIWAEFGITY